MNAGALATGALATGRSGRRNSLAARILSGPFVAGLVAGALTIGSISTRGARDENRIEAGFGSGIAALMAAVTSQATEDFGEAGDFLFLPNRRTIWVVDRSTGRFANYHFRGDQERTVMRSRVVTLNQRDFPAADTIFLLSDRNLSELLWVCNKRTGDVQLWVPRSDGNVMLENQIVTSTDLRKD